MISAQEALERLKEGNRRFVADIGSGETRARHTKFEVIENQRPFAVILGCSDARVPAEMVFDQGFGDLFVIRVAGNVVAPSQIGSVEYAAARAGARLVVVLGHSNCGAVEATIEELRQPTESRSPNLRSIVDRIKPSLDTLSEQELNGELDVLMEHAVRANIRASVEHLRQGSTILEQLIQGDGLMVVGAEYSLGTGVVEFLDAAD
jgi:carbonic anhydrase